jgi:hypothetical protein
VNKVNPFYLVAILLVILVFAFMQLLGVKEELAEVKSEYKVVSSLSSELVGLKKIYGESKKSKKTLQRLLRSSFLKSANIIQKSKKSGISLSSKSMSKNSLNLLVGKILNATYNITLLK